MSILDKIISDKITIVKEAKERYPIKLLEKSLFFHSPIISIKEALKRKDKAGIIAEIKRSSPSTGILNDNVDVKKLSLDYINAGASALSVLTDKNFFGAHKQDLETVRKYNDCPILRKDFVIDEYQLIESKSMGADCILLIAACLDPLQCKKLASFAKSLDLEVLLEVHNKEEIDTYMDPFIDLIGVNNRNLTDFTTNISNSINLSAFLPKELTKISESGIYEAKQIKELIKYGYEGFLIGGHFMKQDDPAEACKNLIHEIRSLSR